jgi:hypothetical protein
VPAFAPASSVVRTATLLALRRVECAPGRFCLIQGRSHTITRCEQYRPIVDRARLASMVDSRIPRPHLHHGESSIRPISLGANASPGRFFRASLSATTLLEAATPHKAVLNRPPLANQ